MLPGQGDHAGAGMPDHLVAPAAALDVPLAPQPGELLVAGDELGDEVGQCLILRMRVAHARRWATPSRRTRSRPHRTRGSPDAAGTATSRCAVAAGACRSPVAAGRSRGSTRGCRTGGSSAWRAAATGRRRAGPVAVPPSWQACRRCEGAAGRGRTGRRVRRGPGAAPRPAPPPRPPNLVTATLTGHASLVTAATVARRLAPSTAAPWRHLVSDPDCSGTPPRPFPG